MNKGIEILLARMESHPEEFARDNDRWEHLFNHYKKYVSDQDKQVFWDKLCEIRSQEFTERVMKQLLADKQEAERREILDIRHIVETGMNEAFKDAYADAFKYNAHGRLVFKDNT